MGKKIKKEKNYYLIKNLLEKNCLYNLLWGERSNGKSYQVKTKVALDNYMSKKERFIYMRRNKEEITSLNVEKYFADLDISEITGGKYNCVQYWRKCIYFATYDPDTFKTTKGELIGYAVALSVEQNYAGGSYLDVTSIIFEEFMTRSFYLSGEVDKLVNFWCTVDRKRGKVKLFLVGNTLTRANPYLSEWGLLRDVVRMKQGEIITKEIPVNEEESVSIAIEFCENSGDTSYVIGKHASMLNEGEWQSDPQPHLPMSIKNYQKLYRVCFFYQSFQFLGEIIRNKETGEKHWFIYPRTRNKQLPDKIITFSDVIMASHYWQSDIYHIKTNSKKLLEYAELFTEDNVFYSDDLTGTEFKQVINFDIRR